MLIDIVLYTICLLFTCVIKGHCHFPHVGKDTVIMATWIKKEMHFEYTMHKVFT